MRIPVEAHTLAELQTLTTPKNVAGGNMESLRDQIYDTQTYLAAGSATLNYFANPNADPTLSNLQQGGTMPDPEYFRIFYIQVDPIVLLTDAAVPTSWRDMERLVRSGRPTLTLTLQGKSYGPWLVQSMHGTGGVDGYGYAAAAAATTAIQYANNGPADGGFCVDGALWLTPKASFSARINWGNPLAVAADTLVRVTLDGVRYRAIR